MKLNIIQQPAVKQSTISASEECKESSGVPDYVTLLPSISLLLCLPPRQDFMHYRALVNPKAKFGDQHVTLAPATFFSKAKTLLASGTRAVAESETMGWMMEH